MQAASDPAAGTDGAGKGRAECFFIGGYEGSEDISLW